QGREHDSADPEDVPDPKSRIVALASATLLAFGVATASCGPEIAPLEDGRPLARAENANPAAAGAPVRTIIRRVSECIGYLPSRKMEPRGCSIHNIFASYLCYNL